MQLEVRNCRQGDLLQQYCGEVRRCSEVVRATQDGCSLMREVWGADKEACYGHVCPMPIECGGIATLRGNARVCQKCGHGEKLHVPCKGQSESVKRHSEAAITFSNVLFFNTKRDENHEPAWKKAKK